MRKNTNQKKVINQRKRNRRNEGQIEGPKSDKSRSLSNYSLCKLQNMPLQNSLLWHKDYFELKAIEKKQAQEKLSALRPPKSRT